ncbi:3-oxo-5-alpha-steroid 4-dehydrogenase-domain-containing protein [Mycena amicta]|nr:3-oxo-5-alpha-steroid 4-dehydrogenase-domain-containing protein [Mycena amicta]
MEAPATIQVEVSLGRKKTPLLRSLKAPLTLSFPASTPPTVRDVKRAIQQAYPAFYADRQKLALPEGPKALADDSVLLFDTAGKVELVVGDLGPQISWKTVFVVEYLGPLLIHPLFYYLPRVFYGTDVEHSSLQKSIYAMVMLHFFKREMETLLQAHSTSISLRINNAPVYIASLMRQCHFETSSRNSSAHYHVLSGLFLAYDAYRPGFSQQAVAGTWRDGPLLKVGWAIWAFAELSNLHTHLTLRSLRPAGTTTRAVPTGYGFSAPFRLTSPNYFFETLAWSAVFLMSGSPACALFIVVSFAQMASWAKKKHGAYKKEFGDKYPRGRKALIPYIF